MKSPKRLKQSGVPTMKKYKVVVDTNIFVSAFLGSKNAKLIVRDIFTEQYSLIMSHEQIQEIKTVLQRPKFSKYIHPHELDEFISLLSLKVIMPSNYGRITDCRDTKDNMILEAAVYGNADFIVSGDEDLLVLNPYRWIQILSPVAFIKHVYGLE
jgi:putative PIN family toxin of toxin-antitoxin system